MYQTGFHAPPLTKVNKYLLITVVALFVLNAILSMAGVLDLRMIFGLSAAGLLSGLVFQIITYPLIESSLIGLLFSGLIVWFMGSDLEARWGTRSYVQFLLTSVLGTALVFTLISLSSSSGSFLFMMPLMGLEGITLALLFAYGYLFPERQMVFMMLFPMKARYFCMILGAIQLYLAVFSTYGKVAWAHIAAMVWGILYIKFKAGELSGKTWSNYMKKRRRENQKKQMYVVKDEKEDDKPRYWQ